MTTFTREDFEMAARAAGLEPERYIRGRGMTVHNPATGTGSNHWNPPDDDGDALRLAVKLDMHIMSMSNGQPEFSNVVAYGPNSDDFHDIYENHNGDPCAATRHAIFRAAIAIGRAITAPDLRPNKSDAAQSPSVEAPKQQTTTLFHPNEMPDSHDPV